MSRIKLNQSSIARQLLRAGLYQPEKKLNNIRAELYQPEKKQGRLYLHLTHKEWAVAWINGGKVPLSLTTKYKTEERQGIYTPDENLHRQVIGAPDADIDKAFGSGLFSGGQRIGLYDLYATPVR